MRLEAFAVNCDFWSEVLQARSLKPIDFALGAAMITTASQLKQAGGFEALAAFLADDYQLGNRIAKHGEIIISPVIAECRSAPQTARDVWMHQLRWARTIRFCQPGPYFFSILNDATLWSLLWMIVMPRAWPISLAIIAVRSVTAFFTERKLTGRFDVVSLLLAPIKDLLRAIIWALSLLGNTVVWRGRKYRVQRGGKLIPF
jgi:ceramide glucosyltransferase